MTTEKRLTCLLALTLSQMPKGTRAFAIREFARELADSTDKDTREAEIAILRELRQYGQRTLH